MKRTRYICIALGLAIVLGAAVVVVHPAGELRRPETYAELTTLPAEQLEKIDIALMNLLCAEGLPGAENLDIGRCLSVLDHWAEVVKQSEQKYSAYSVALEIFPSSVYLRACTENMHRRKRE